MSLQSEHHNNGQRPPTSDPAKPAATVCVLDDDPSVVKALERLLRAGGVPVRTFTDPQALLDYARENQPPVVVTDIWMPRMDGLEVQRRLRDHSPETRVIVLTSNDDPAVRSKAMAAGAFGFFLKPADDDEFLARIEASLNGAHATR